MKVANEEKWEEIGYAKLCMNFVHYLLSVVKSLMYSNL